MKTSEDINEIAAALSKLQGELTDVHKNSKGFGYNYADLSSILEYIRPLLKKYELSIVQPVGGDDGKIIVTTMLMHSSGQFISEEVQVKVDLNNKKMNSLQAAGSTITYLRRYSLSTIIGLSATDDDGKSGGEHIDSSRNNNDNDNKHLEQAKKDLISLAVGASVSNASNKEIINKALAHYNVESVNELNSSQLQAVMSRISKKEE